MSHCGSPFCGTLSLLLLSALCPLPSCLVLSYFLFPAFRSLFFVRRPAGKTDSPPAQYGEEDEMQLENSVQMQPCPRLWPGFCLVSTACRSRHQRRSMCTNTFSGRPHLRLFFLPLQVQDADRGSIGIMCICRYGSRQSLLSNYCAPLAGVKLLGNHWFP